MIEFIRSQDRLVELERQSRQQQERIDSLKFSEIEQKLKKAHDFNQRSEQVRDRRFQLFES